MDVACRNQLVEKLKSRSILVGQYPGPTISLEDFFEGNDEHSYADDTVAYSKIGIDAS